MTDVRLIDGKGELHVRGRATGDATITKVEKASLVAPSDGDAMGYRSTRQYKHKQKFTRIKISRYEIRKCYVLVR